MIAPGNIPLSNSALVLPISLHSRLPKTLHCCLPATPGWGSFNTLAQNGTNAVEKPVAILAGKGSELSDKHALKCRAKRKVMTQAMVLGLLDANNNKADNRDWRKSYWNTYHCQGRVFTADGKLHGTYCKNKFCTLCCSIRKALIINHYLPVICTWTEAHFVTLTIKAVRDKKLRDALRSILRCFHWITEKYRKRYNRGNGIVLRGIKSLECNFNPERQTYNPHLHLIVENKEMADIFIAEWLQRWGAKWTYKKAQHSRKVENTVRDLIEIIKYGSKIFTEPDLTNKMKRHGKVKIYVSALDNIFKAMRGLRIFERFGFNLSKAYPKAEASKVVREYEEWVFKAEEFDWVNPENEARLSNYEPAAELVQVLTNCIDTSSE